MEKQTRRIGQIAITVNGEACPPDLAQSPQFPFAQRIFELLDGPATNMPNVKQFDTVNECLMAAIGFLDSVRTVLATPPPDVNGPARSGVFRDA